MKHPSALAAAFLVLALGGCEDPEATAAREAAEAEQAAATDASEPSFQVAQVTDAPRAVEDSIDWAAAREARTKAPVTDANIQVQSVGAGQVPEVPVLLPSGIVQPQNARAPMMVKTEDGYFATYQTPKYDAIVNGTKKAYATDGGEAASDSEEMVFTQSDASAQLAFSRFGADYLIEFECRQVDGGDSCITEDEARAFAESLFVAETQ